MRHARSLLVDIETAPLAWWATGPGTAHGWALEQAAVMEPTATAKKEGEHGILQWRAAKARDLWTGCSLRSHLAQVVCVCLQLWPDGELVTIADARDERAVLAGLGGYMRGLVSGGTGKIAVIAWNGKRFDFPMLAGRYMMQGEPAKAAQWNSNIRYADRRELGLGDGYLRFVDAHDAYPMARGDRTRLRDLDTPAMRAADPLDGDGGLVLGALQADRLDDVVRHCQVDVRDRLATVWSRIHPQLLALAS